VEREGGQTLGLALPLFLDELHRAGRKETTKDGMKALSHATVAGRGGSTVLP
jgi:hypothetical protein